MRTNKGKPNYLTTLTKFRVFFVLFCFVFIYFFFIFSRNLSFQCLGRFYLLLQINMTTVFANNRRLIIWAATWEYKNPSWVSMQDREISPEGRNFNQGRGLPSSWLKFLPLGWDFLSCMDTHDRFFSFPPLSGLFLGPAWSCAILTRVKSLFHIGKCVRKCIFWYDCNASTKTRVTLRIRSFISLCCQHEETLHTWLPKMYPVKILNLNLRGMHKSEGTFSDVVALIFSHSYLVLVLKFNYIPGILYI